MRFGLLLSPLGLVLLVLVGIGAAVTWLLLLAALWLCVKATEAMNDGAARAARARRLRRIGCSIETAEAELPAMLASEARHRQRHGFVPAHVGMGGPAERIL
jgi:hypothetical protein